MQARRELVRVPGAGDGAAPSLERGHQPGVGWRGRGSGPAGRARLEQQGADRVHDSDKDQRGDDGDGVEVG